MEDDDKNLFLPSSWRCCMPFLFYPRRIGIYRCLMFLFGLKAFISGKEQAFIR